MNLLHCVHDDTVSLTSEEKRHSTSAQCRFHRFVRELELELKYGEQNVQYHGAPHCDCHCTRHRVYTLHYFGVRIAAAIVPETHFHNDSWYSTMV